VRKTLSDSLVALGKKDPNVILLTGDHGYSLFDDYRIECPDQYINAGVAEQNMVGLAAGLARSGFKPIVYGLSAFIPIRVLEQIKLDVAYDSLPVIFIGDGAGFVYSYLGMTHQSTEDIACTRSVPNLSVYSPADRFELEQCLNIAYKDRSPVYLRLGKADLGDLHCSLPNFNLGDLIALRQNNSKYSLISTGSMLSTAVKISDELNVDVDVWSVPFIKPINLSMVKSICRRSRAIIVLEEHSKFGGLGSVIAEISSASCPVKILQISVNDCFSEKCGSYDYLLKQHKLDYKSIYKNIFNFLQGF